MTRLSIIALFIITFNLNSQTVNVPLGHWVYDVLEKFEARGFIEDLLDGVRPYSRSDAAKGISHLLDLTKKHPQQFTYLEMEWIYELQNEFYDDLHISPPEETQIRNIINSQLFRSWWPTGLYNNSRNFFSYYHKDFSLYVDPVIQIKRFNDELINEYINGAWISNGLTFRGYGGEHIGYYFDLHDNTFISDVPIYKNVIIKNSGWPWLNPMNHKNVYFDENLFYLFVTLPHLNIEVGRDYSKWGPMHNKQLFLSSHSPAMDMIRLTFLFSHLKITSLTGFLIYVDERINTPGIQPHSLPKKEKFIAASRAEYNFGGGFNAGFNYALVYGNRSLDLKYIVPFYPIKSKPDDNILIGFDAEWNFINGYKIYGEVIVDDLDINNLLSDSYKNRYGFGLGFFSFNFLSINNLSFRVEYQRLRPYVYTHSNSFSIYKNYDSNLASVFGPNSDQFTTNIKYWFKRTLWVDFSMNYNRHGNNYTDNNIGGDIDKPFHDGDSRNVVFLGGEIDKKSRIYFGLYHEIFRRSLVYSRIGRLMIPKEGWRNYWEIGWQLNYGQK